MLRELSWRLHGSLRLCNLGAARQGGWSLWTLSWVFLCTLCWEGTARLQGRVSAENRRRCGMHVRQISQGVRSSLASLVRSMGMSLACEPIATADVFFAACQAQVNCSVCVVPGVNEVRAAGCRCGSASPWPVDARPAAPPPAGDAAWGGPDTLPAPPAARSQLRNCRFMNLRGVDLGIPETTQDLFAF